MPRQLAITAIDLAGPILIKFGSDEQKSRYLEPIRTGRPRLDAAVLRAGRRFRPGRGADEGGEDGDRLANQRPEGLEFGCQLGDSSVCFSPAPARSRTAA